MSGGDFDGRVVVVTGGTRGLGRAIAHGLASAGASVVIRGRSGDSRQEAEAISSDVRGFGCDVADAQSSSRFAQSVADGFGAVDVLVNNAGTNPWYKRSEDTPIDEWRAIVDINHTGARLGCHLFGRQMLAAGRGSIVNITSVAAYSGLPRTAAYCAAKRASKP